VADRPAVHDRSTVPRRYRWTHERPPSSLSRMPPRGWQRSEVIASWPGCFLEDPRHGSSFSARCNSAFACHRQGNFSRLRSGRRRRFFVSILLGRLTSVVERIRHLNHIAADDRSRAHLKSDLPRLRRRAGLLNTATRLALASGVRTALLLAAGWQPKSATYGPLPGPVSRSRTGHSERPSRRATSRGRTPARGGLRSLAAGRRRAERRRGAFFARDRQA
jgi:hypothetical protein